MQDQSEYIYYKQDNARSLPTDIHTGILQVHGVSADIHRGSCKISLNIYILQTSTNIKLTLYVQESKQQQVDGLVVVSKEILMGVKIPGGG